MLRATFNFVLNLRMATIVCLSVCLEWKQEHATVCQVSCCKTIVGVFGLTWLTCLCLLWNGQPLVVEVQSQCKYTVYFFEWFTTHKSNIWGCDDAWGPWVTAVWFLSCTLVYDGMTPLDPSMNTCGSLFSWRHSCHDAYMCWIWPSLSSYVLSTSISYAEVLTSVSLKVNAK